MFDLSHYIQYHLHSYLSTIDFIALSKLSKYYRKYKKHVFFKLRSTIQANITAKLYNEYKHKNYIYYDLNLYTFLTATDFDKVGIIEPKNHCCYFTIFVMTFNFIKLKFNYTLFVEDKKIVYNLKSVNNLKKFANSNSRNKQKRKGKYNFEIVSLLIESKSTIERDMFPYVVMMKYVISVLLKFDQIGICIDIRKYSSLMKYWMDKLLLSFYLTKECDLPPSIDLFVYDVYNKEDRKYVTEYIKNLRYLIWKVYNGYQSSNYILNIYSQIFELYRIAHSPQALYSTPCIIFVNFLINDNWFDSEIKRKTIIKWYKALMLYFTYTAKLYIKDSDKDQILLKKKFYKNVVYYTDIKDEFSKILI